jgi:hypothetical protein
MMKKISIAILALLVSIFSYAYEWDSIGPSDVQVNNFNTVYYNILTEILCTSDGILINYGDDNWVEYTYSGLSAWSAVGLDPNNILVLLGNGSWSDGIYKFNLTTHYFEIVEWMAFPNFLHFCEYDNTYYAGSEYGMWKSTDGTSFTSIEYFDMKNCRAFAYFENNFVVSADFNTHYSSNGGGTWNPPPIYSPPNCDMTFRNDETLFGVFPGLSYSSGLWSSVDFGENWDVEFWDMLMSSVGIDSGGKLFVGWESDGVAAWDPITQELESFNDGLPNLNINKITSHLFLDCYNIIACTDSGAYILTNYPVGIEEEKLGDKQYILSNYPNPFNNTTTIVFSLDHTSLATLSVYNVLGNKVETLYDGIAEAGQEYRLMFSGTTLSEGIYYYHLQSGTNVNIVKKMILVE